MLDFYIELNINANTRQFEEWLNLYTLRTLPSIIKLENGNILTVENGSSKMGEIQEVMRYQIQASISKPRPHEKVEKIISLPVIEINITEFSDNQINIKFYIERIEVYPYLEGLIWEIVNVWPEAKRQATYSLSEVAETRMDAILFDFILEIDPTNFIGWCHAELKESFPGGFTHTFNNDEIITNVGGDYFYPDNFNPFWEYVIFAKDTMWSEDSETGETIASQGFYGLIARIEIRHITNDRYHVKCFYGTEHPQIVELLMDFVEKLKFVYDPQLIMTGKNSEKEELNPWDKIPDHSWYRVAIKMWCNGYTNREISARVSVTARAVTNQICILRKQYPEARIPYDEERRKLMMLDDTR